MHITAYCPECQSRYQLNADLRGRKMRCPNSGCQAIFVVREATSGPPRDGTNGPRATDARGNLVPLTGDQVPRRPGTAGPVELDWRAVPPPVQSRGTAADQSTGETSNDIPVAPLARRPPLPTAPPPRVREWEEPSPSARRRRGLLITIGLVVLVLAGGGYGITHVVRSLAHDEETRRAEADKDYAGGLFASAAKKYRVLAEKHGRGEHAAQYRFLADLSDLQDAATPSIADPTSALAKAEAFAKQYDTRDPHLKDNAVRKALTDGLAAIVTGFADATDAAALTADGESTAPPLLDQGQTALALLAPYGGPITELRARLDKSNERLAHATERRRSIAAVRKLLEGPRPDVNRARLEAIGRQVADDPNLMREIERAEADLVQHATYKVLNQAPQPTGPAAGPPGLLLDTAPASTRPPDEVVLAVARGLLYALDARSGRRLWACRVGLDAGDLPARVPATGNEPELVLVATSNPPGLTARNIRTGAVVWHQPLEAPTLGRPTQNAGRLFVPTAGPAGLVYDLDVHTGVARGRFVTNQELAGGGAFDAATQRLYVPVHGQGVYVFSYGPEGPKCEGLLRTNHPAGSLRGEPIVVSGEEGSEALHFLVLGQADGLGAMTLRAFWLVAAATESPRDFAVHLPGWSWFPPYHDPETIALVTDAGAIGLFGIRQKGDEDQPLFPLLPESDNPKSGNPREWVMRNPKSARAQLVHASESGFWVLADGVLRHWRLGLTRAAGRQLIPAWGDGRRLGSPLHAAQVSADRRTLFVVTQTDSPSSYRATAVNAANGDIVWQQPLGLTAQGDPLALGGAVIVLDQSGGLYRFAEKGDIHPFPPDKAVPQTEARGGREKMNVPFFSGGREIAPPVPDQIGTPYLLPTADGQSAWALLVHAKGDSYQLTLRHVAADGTVTSGKSVPLPAPLAGTPALGPTAVVLPMTDGQLYRVTLDAADPRGALGPTWRGLGIRPDVRGHVVHWSGDEFLVSDGGRKLLRLSWPAGPRFETDMQWPLELEQRLVGASARLKDGAIAVVDVGGGVTLIGGVRPTIVRKWRLGAVTAGPWAVGDRLAVVVDRRMLVWLNPEADKPLWSYKDKTDGDGIESPPRLIDGKLVIADLAGRFVAVDPATGEALGKGYQFPAEAAPAAAVTAFGPGQLFAPLTDGTVLLLPLADLGR